MIGNSKLISNMGVVNLLENMFRRAGKLEWLLVFPSIPDGVVASSVSFRPTPY